MRRTPEARRRKTLNLMNSPLLSYYGDDLTGSTDVMEALGVNINLTPVQIAQCLTSRMP